MRGTGVKRGAAALAIGAATLAASIAYVVGDSRDQTARAVGAARSLPESKFAVFSREKSQADAERNPFGGPLAEVDPRTVRKLRVKGSRRIWAATGDRTCVGMTSAAENSIASACVDPDVASANGVWSISRPAPADIAGAELPQQYAEIAALLPDGVTTVTITVAEGQATTANVQDNGVVLAVNSRPLAATWTDGNGVQQTLDLSPQD